WFDPTVSCVRLLQNETPRAFANLAFGAATTTVTSPFTVPSAGPADAYTPYPFEPGRLPPYAAFMEFRPTMTELGHTARDGWDAVWMRPEGRYPSSPAVLCLLLEAWFSSVHCD